MKRTLKKKIIIDSAKHKKDTGSPQVQVAILSEKIKLLTEHLENHRNDENSRHGLLGMVGKRRKLLNYLKDRAKDDYEKIVKKIGLRK